MLTRFMFGFLAASSILLPQFVDGGSADARGNGPSPTMGGGEVSRRSGNARPNRFSPSSTAANRRPSCCHTWEVKRASRQLDDQRTEHTLTYTDPKTGLEVQCVGIEYRDFPAVDWVLYAKNTGEQGHADPGKLVRSGRSACNAASRPAISRFITSAAATPGQRFRAAHARLFLPPANSKMHSHGGPRRRARPAAARRSSRCRCSTSSAAGRA